ncbi:MAG: P1 family peptidase, partial [Nocardioidaceae bacterium]
MSPQEQEQEQRPRRARELGLGVGTVPVGPANAVTDVPGVLVGHTTLHEGARIRSGVTAVVPAALGADRRRFPCGLFVGNGHGKLVGATQVAELGVLETPVVLTSTLSVFRAADAVLSHMLDLPGYEQVRSLNPLVGETNDGYLSDIRARPVTEAHVLGALRGASADLPGEGCVGAGTGTAALGFKAGIGTSSRVVEVAGEPATVGALVQSNFSGVLTVCGVPMPVAELMGELVDESSREGDPGPTGNSCMIVLATDAALDARQLGRLARRAVFAMARVGSDFAGGSGDYAIAFSTAEHPASYVDDSHLDPMFAATLDVVEEALLNSLMMARTTTGVDGHTRHAVPHAAMLAASPPPTCQT